MFNEKNITNALTQLMTWYAEDEPAITMHCLTLHGGIVSYYTYWNKV